MNNDSLAPRDPSPTSHPSDIDAAIADLRQGAAQLCSATLEERIGWIAECIAGVATVSHEWVEESCRAKRIACTSSSRAEEILVGPVAVLRYLQLIRGSLRELQTVGKLNLPGNTHTIQGQVRVPVFPTNQLYDALVFQPMTAETWLQPDVTSDAIHGKSLERLMRQVAVEPRVTLILGAGNSSAIPLTDALTKILHEDSAVLLKMNPVNDYLGPLFERALRRLIDANVLRFIYGGSSVGQYGVRHPGIDTVHMTGCVATHDSIVWGDEADTGALRPERDLPKIDKPITSDLGNVTPWIFVPGQYSETQLRAQAEHIAASIVHNASFNCVTTKMLITWKHWPLRDRFLDSIESILGRTPPRYAYYPGAAERYAEFSGQAVPIDPAGTLPWTLRRGVNPSTDQLLLQRESFVCVTGETALDSASPEAFLVESINFANDNMWGNLAAALTVPRTAYV